MMYNRAIGGIQQRMENSATDGRTQQKTGNFLRSRGSAANLHGMEWDGDTKAGVETADVWDTTAGLSLEQVLQQLAAEEAMAGDFRNERHTQLLQQAAWVLGEKVRRQARHWVSCGGARSKR